MQVYFFNQKKKKRKKKTKNPSILFLKAEDDVSRSV